jgi:hypothetical protein
MRATRPARRIPLDFIILITSDDTIDSYTNRGVITEQSETAIFFSFKGLAEVAIKINCHECYSSSPA